MISRKESLERMIVALEAAKLSGNQAMVNTLTPMILTEKARSVKSSEGTDIGSIVTKTVRPVVNPKTMAKKLKSELHDTRVKIPSRQLIQARYNKSIKNV